MCEVPRLQGLPLDSSVTVPCPPTVIQYEKPAKDVPLPLGDVKLGT
jgi:hypothetical protein